MKIVLAGSRKVDPALLRTRLVEFLGSVPGDAVEVHLRRGVWTVPGKFEQVVARICRDMAGVTVVWHQPQLDEDRSGRASVYHRDIEMVEGADMVLLFFEPNEAVDGYSGTAHLMDKAIAAGVTVEAFSIDDDGNSVWIGGYDGRS